MNTLTEQQRGILEMLVAMLIMGTVGYFVVESGQEAHNVVFFRCVFGVLFLLVYCFMAGHFKNTQLTRKNLMLIVVSGIFLICNWIMLFASFKSASISTSTVIYHAQPFFFVLIWAAVMREVVPANKIFWIVIAFIGVVLVANIDTSSFTLSSEYVKGILLALAAAIFWAISAAIVKHLKGVKPHLTTLIQLAIGVLILFPFVNTESVSSVSNIQWSYLLILGAFHSCLTYILMYSSYQKLTAPVIAVMTFIYPAVAILVDFYFYDESLNAPQICGVVLILFSSFAVNQNFPVLFKRWTAKA